MTHVTKGESMSSLSEEDEKTVQHALRDLPLLKSNQLIQEWLHARCLTRTYANEVREKLFGIRDQRVEPYLLSLPRGTPVKAKMHLDPKGADTHKFTQGVVFEPSGIHGDGAGPMVRWLQDSESPGGVCNIYPGDVWVWDSYYRRWL